MCPWKYPNYRESECCRISDFCRILYLCHGIKKVRFNCSSASRIKFRKSYFYLITGNTPIICKVLNLAIPVPWRNHLEGRIMHRISSLQPMRSSSAALAIPRHGATTLSYLFSNQMKSLTTIPSNRIGSQVRQITNNNPCKLENPGFNFRNDWVGTSGKGNLSSFVLCSQWYDKECCCNDGSGLHVWKEKGPHCHAESLSR